MRLKARSVLALLAFLAVVSQASAADRVFLPVSTATQEVEYDNGEPVLLARTEKAFVAASYISRDKKSCLLKIELTNISETPFTVAEHDITAASAQGSLDVVTYAERLKAQKREAMWENIALGVAAAAEGYSAASAGYSQTDGTFRASGTGSSIKGAYSESTYDSTAAYQAQTLAQIRSEQRVDRQAANEKFARQELKDRAFRSNTLSPGELVVGDVQVALPKKNRETPAEFVVAIVIAGEPVRLLFREQL